MSSLIDRAQRQSTGRRPAADPDEARKLLTVAFRLAAVTLVLLSVLVVVTLMAANSDLTGTFGAIAATWLAIHQVPVTIDDTTLGVLPILPTVVMVWFSAKGSAGAVTTQSSRSWILRVACASLAGPFLITLTALAVIADASVVIPLSTPNVVVAVAWTLGVHAVALAIGFGTALWPTLQASLPGWVLGAIRPAARALVTLLGAGALAVLVSMLFAWSTTGELLERGETVLGMLGLTVLSILYLPNVVIGAVSALTGATARVGDVSVSVFGDVGGPLPPLPILAAVPDGPAGGLWPILLAAPFVVGIFLGRDCGRKVAGQQALFTVLAAAAGVGVVAALAGLMGGGELGTFGAVDLNWWAFGLLAFVWLALSGSVTAVAVAWVRSRRRSGAGEGADETHAAESADVPDEIVASPLGAPEALEQGSGETSEPASAPVAATPSTSAASARVLEAEIVEDDDTEAPDATPKLEASDEKADAAETHVVDAEVEELEDSGGTEADLPQSGQTPSD
ncbi:DUF6350 family protein [Rhodococcus sp. NPDC058521]|uniref:cell division protein PerM n=1 Tax=Rhodococcus sp. NPDC058521 TaxID=3346536 RepID=UPI00364B1490